MKKNKPVTNNTTQLALQGETSKEIVISHLPSFYIEWMSSFMDIAGRNKPTFYSALVMMWSYSQSVTKEELDYATIQFAKNEKELYNDIDYTRLIQKFIRAHRERESQLFKQRELERKIRPTRAGDIAKLAAYNQNNKPRS